jgi:ribosomal protein L37AE/L43A
MSFLYRDIDGSIVCMRCRVSAVQISDGNWQCASCESDRKKLAKGIGYFPSLVTKARNFATSAAKHVAAGMPQASAEEVARRFAICEGCEHFDGQACRQCGCPVVREKKFLSKLSWANESCPVGKWGKEKS